MMEVVRIWLDNQFRNFNYLVGCPKQKVAIAIDPLDIDKCMTEAKKRNWRIIKIVCTHEHLDHVGGVKALAKQTGAPIAAYKYAIGTIAGITQELVEGDTIAVGESGALEVLEIPGHTMLHIGLHDRVQAMLFCGDTIFVGGVGNCQYGGSISCLYNTINKINALPDETKIFCSHDYAETNLSFTCMVEPDNLTACEMLKRVRVDNGDTAPVTTLKQEREFNLFFRLGERKIRKFLTKEFSDFSLQSSDETVFAALRDIRNIWNPEVTVENMKRNNNEES